MTEAWHNLGYSYVKLRFHKLLQVESHALPVHILLHLYLRHVVSIVHLHAYQNLFPPKEKPLGCKAEIQSTFPVSFQVRS